MGNRKSKNMDTPLGDRGKQLLLVRHAKSSWADVMQQDFDRPLNERGEKDAPEMAKKLAKRDISIDAFISSPAKRAFSTARYFAKEFDVKKKKIIKMPELYEASVNDFYNTIGQLDDNYTTVALFSHNPGLTAFVNGLTNMHIDDMPTCSIFAVSIQTDQWKNFKEAPKEFWFFDYPKNIS